MHWPLGQPPVGEQLDESPIADVGINGVAMNQPDTCTCQ
jgi:hypothetical protein